MEKKILAIVPAFNESLNIENTYNDLKKYQPNIDIIVIDDCSIDNTKEVVESLDGSFLLSLPVNLGIGGAVQVGLKYAKNNNYDIAFQFDGDGQHRADQFLKLYELLESGNDIAIGSRFIKNDKTNFRSSFIRRVGINFFAFLITFLIREKITDPTSGFRAFNKKAISIFANDYPFDFPEPEVIVIANKKKLKIEEVYVLMNEREFGTSSIGALKSIAYMFKVTVSILLAFFRES